MDYLRGLNEKQRLAVEYGNGPLLVLAGAGSGKTRVLTHRIAHLIAHHRVDPMQIFAVTFTNKAAAEMRGRVQKLLSQHFNWNISERELWVSTFHSACVRILRSDIQHLGYNPQFTIYDDSDQLSVIKAAMKELKIAEQTMSAKAIQSRINKIKNDGDDHSTYRSQYGGPQEDAFVRVFERYAQALQLSSALDFADLILLVVRLFQRNPRVLKGYQERFQHVLIDEYQDTNRCQYLFMKLLAGERANICAVGDEDQSIYRWRGADISNILNFEQDYPNAQIFKLEENYRSTKNIIEAASRVISHNTERRDKELWTQNGQGEKINLIEAYDEHDEALKVSAEISARLGQNISLNQMAIFYRTNAQSRVIEDTMRAKGVNYQIFGGLKFYARLEIKDALAYLRLLVNPDDDVSFRRIVNVPARGIGAKSLEKLASRASELGISHLALLLQIFEGKQQVDLGRGVKNFKTFYDILLSLRKSYENLLPSDLLSVVLEDSGYRESLAQEKTVESQSRLENLAELKQSIVEYELRVGADNPNAPITLEGFLQEIALVSDTDKFDPEAPALKMMTIHMAKGLEFDFVSIVGLEEELFPSVRAWEAEDPANVEEERRLFYVAMTRARRALSLFFAKNRTVFGTSHFRVTSRFVEEIPPEYVELHKADYFSRRRGGGIGRPGLPGRSLQDLDEDFDQSSLYEGAYTDIDGESDGDDEDGLRAGNRVVHPIFGEGIVRKVYGADKLLVEFAGRGVKKISRKFSQLKGV